AVHAGANDDRLILLRVDARRIVDDRTRRAVDAGYDVLEDRGARPQEIAGLAVQRVDDAGLARDAGDYLAPLTGLEPRIDPADLARIGRDRSVDQQSLERMVEIPVIDQMLVVPNDLARL